MFLLSICLCNPLRNITYILQRFPKDRKRTEKPSEEPSNKRSKWGSFAASRKAKQTVSISTDSLKVSSFSFAYLTFYYLSCIK